MTKLGMMVILVAGVLGHGYGALSLSPKALQLEERVKGIELEVFVYGEVYSNVGDSAIASTIPSRLPESTKSALRKVYTNVVEISMATLEQEAEGLVQWEREYLLAYMTYIKAKWEADMVGNTKIRFLLDRANDHVKKAMKTDGKNPVLWNLYGEIQSLYLRTAGGMAAITYSQEAKRAYERAIKYKKDYARPWINLASWYLFAPQIAGGSASKSVKLLTEAERYARDDYERFYGAVWKAMGLFKLGKKTEARQSIQRARTIAPHNTWVQWLSNELEKGNSPLGAMSGM